MSSQIPDLWPCYEMDKLCIWIYEIKKAKILQPKQKNSLPLWVKIKKVQNHKDHVTKSRDAQDDDNWHLLRHECDDIAYDDAYMWQSIVQGILSNCARYYKFTFQWGSKRNSNGLLNNESNGYCQILFK